jgi:elongation factor P
MYSASDLRKGLKIEIDGAPWIISDFDFCKPGKGTALYRCKLKNMLTGTTMDRTYRPNDKLGKPNLRSAEYTYVYYDGSNYVFSDNVTYEEVFVSEDVLGNSANFLVEESVCEILFYNDLPVEVTLPIFIEKESAFTEPGVRGDTATNVTKSAKIDNGTEIQVPIFVNEGDWIKIDTRTGAYVERVKK